MNSLNDEYDSIFDKIELMKHNPQIFKFEKLHNEINYAALTIIKEDFAYFPNSEGSEIKQRKIALTNEYLFKFSVK